MKFELRRLPDRSDEALLAELRRVADLVSGTSLSVHEFGAHSKVSATTLRRRFGNWENALAAAGLATRFNAVPLSSKAKEQRGKGASYQRTC